MPASPARTRARGPLGRASRKRAETASSTARPLASRSMACPFQQVKAPEFDGGFAPARRSAARTFRARNTRLHRWISRSPVQRRPHVLFAIVAFPGAEFDREECLAGSDFCRAGGSVFELDPGPLGGRLEGVAAEDLDHLPLVDRRS